MKQIALLLSVVMLCLMLSACGDTPDTPSSEESASIPEVSVSVPIESGPSSVTSSVGESSEQSLSSEESSIVDSVPLADITDQLILSSTCAVRAQQLNFPAQPNTYGGVVQADENSLYIRTMLDRTISMYWCHADGTIYDTYTYEYEEKPTRRFPNDSAFEIMDALGEVWYYDGNRVSRIVKLPDTCNTSQMQVRPDGKAALFAYGLERYIWVYYDLWEEEIITQFDVRDYPQFEGWEADSGIFINHDLARMILFQHPHNLKSICVSLPDMSFLAEDESIRSITEISNNRFFLGSISPNEDHPDWLPACIAMVDETGVESIHETDITFSLYHLNDLTNRYLLFTDADLSLTEWTYALYDSETWEEVWRFTVPSFYHINYISEDFTTIYLVHSQGGEEGVSVYRLTIS